MTTAAPPQPLSLERLSKSFDARFVLNGVDLVVEPGSVLGLLGANGSGKTTLLKCALGLLRPTGGTASVLGEDAWNLSAHAKADLGYVPQEVSSYPWMRVRQAIAYTAAFYPTWNHDLVADLCERWRLPLEERTGTLSVGQLQSLGIVLALGHEPSLLILDEPVASLDPLARRAFLRTLLDIIESDDRTVIFSTHITSDLERVASHVAVLREGNITYHGGLDQLKDQVKRLRITAKQPLPPAFAVPDALHTRIDGTTATAAVNGFDPGVIDDLRRTWDAEVEVTDLNLEEIFVELHGG